jgi:hypothetical protein
MRTDAAKDAGLCRKDSGQEIFRDAESFAGRRTS